MVITDIVYEEIYEQIAAHRPERGGALYGPRGYPFVTHFEFDVDGITSSVSYVPSTALIENVPHVERTTGLQFKGIVHSHPHGLIRPSYGDEQTVGSFFRLNPHLSQMALPIVQSSRGSFGKKTEAEFLHWYRAERAGASFGSGRSSRVLDLFRASAISGIASQNPVRIVDEDFHVLPIFAHMKILAATLKRQGITLSDMTASLQVLKVQNAELVGLSAQELGVAMGRELYFFVSIDYPIVPPVVLRAVNGSTTQLRFQWDGFGEHELNLAEVADAFCQIS